MLQNIFRLYYERWDFFSDLIVQHIRISMIAISISASLGLLIGILIYNNKKLASAIMGIVNIFYTIPSISMLGFLIPFTGIGNKTAIIALSIYGLLPMVRNTYTGITQIDPALLEAAKGMGSTKWQILYKIRLPLAVPVLVAGIRSMVVMTISLSGISAFIGAGGLGVAVYRGITTNNARMTFAGSILIAALALLADCLVAGIERLLNRKGRYTDECN